MTYAIADEPIETSRRHLVVNPSAPLLAEMLCGTWLSLPWFAWNAIAMGSPTRRKEIALCALSLVVTAVLAAAVLALREGGVIESRTMLRCALLGIITWKLAMAQAIYTLQSRTFHVYEYYGGPVRPASYVLSTGWLLRDVVIGLSDDPLWGIIVSGVSGLLGGGA
ncbi:MAG TPA: hypothetical protein VNO30_50620 [Kofleriaceae bacterium]|nr:hypothetical protein [Kofleriaceae bacterium]